MTRPLAIAACLSLLAVSSIAQEVTGTIVGSVVDSTGAVIPGAKVTVTATDRNQVVRTIATDSSGAFAAPLLPIGIYSLKAEAGGFKPLVTERIEVHLEDKLTFRLRMQVGDVAETVTVEASAVGVDLQSPVAEGMVSGDEIRELSLNNRNFIELISLIPGVTSTSTTDEIYIGTTNPYGGTNVVPFSIGGGRNSANNYTVDGADNVDRGSNQTLLSFPNVDTIAEFKVVRGQYSADTGRAGAGQINVVTKAGTRQYHVSLFEFFRNDALAANDFFNNMRGIARKPLRYNNFGYLFSGPVPKLGTASRANNRTFFLWSQEFRRVSTFGTQQSYLPTADLKNGIFAAPVCVQFTGTACTTMSNHITNINPVAAAYIKDIWSKLPDGDRGTYTYFAPMRSAYNFREDLVKIDHTFNPGFSMFVKFASDSIPTQEPGGIFANSAVPGVAATQTNAPGRSWVIRATNTFSSTLLNEAGYSFSSGAIVSRPVGLISSVQSPDIKVQLPFKVTDARVPNLTVSGFNQLTGIGPYDDFNRNHNIYDNLTRILGKMTLKAGASFNYYQKTENSSGSNNVGSFTSPNTPQAGSRPSSVSSYQQSWANFLLGYVSTFSQASLDLTPDMRQNQLEWYLQNDYRVKPNFTLNLGVRCSSFWQPYDVNHMLANFDPQVWNPAKAPQVNPSNGNLVLGTGDLLNGIIVNGQNSPYGKKISNEDVWKLAPRAGFAWDPFKRGRTAVRAGYGISYDSTLVGIFEQNIFNDPPYQNTVTITNTRLDDPASGVTSISAAPKALYATPLPAMIPYVQQWSFDIQQSAGRNAKITAGYYGSKGTHLLGIVDINAVPPGAGAAAGIVNANTAFTSTTEPRLNALRPYPGFIGMYAKENWFNSNYNSLQVGAQKQLSGGSNLRLAYTFSKTLASSPNDRTNAPQDLYNRRLDYARTTYDRTQVLTLSYIYNLPFGRNLHGLAGHTVKGWQISGIISFASGLPLRVYSSLGSDWAGLGTLSSSPASTSLRTDMVSDPNKDAPHAIAKWFNTAAFVAPRPGHVGNAPASYVVGPGYQKYDVSLFKNFRLTERSQLQFRTEAFNMPNHTNYLGVVSNVGSTTFGQVSSAREPRRIQLALKLSW